MMPHKIEKCAGCLHINEPVSCSSCKSCKIELSTGRMTHFEHDPDLCCTCADYRKTPICNKYREYSEFRAKGAGKITTDQGKCIASRLEEVRDEILRAAEIHGIDFNSSNEAAGVVREEYLELEHELFHGDPERAREEAIQLAAVAVKTVIYLDGIIGRNGRIKQRKREEERE